MILLLSKNLIEFFAKQTTDFIYRNNQYINLNSSQRNKLVTLYNNFLDNISHSIKTNETMESISNSMHSTIKNHFHNHKRFIDDTMSNTKQKFLFNRAICSEYSPELQIAMLNIDINRLIEPVLDLGCGKRGNLVRHLRNKGIDAYGIDRIITDTSSPYTIQTDWFEFDWKKNRWGSVISHLSFSNHFMFNHLYKYGNPTSYAKLYMKVLNSLRRNGTFYYAPSLPFIESHLDNSVFVIEKSQISQYNLEAVMITNTKLQ